MFYVNKIIGWTLSPLGVFFLAVGFGWLGCRFASRWRWMRLAGRLLVGFGLVQLWVLSCSFSIRFVGFPLEGRETDVMDLPKADAIVLLGGGVGVHEKCGRTELFCGADRVWTAGRLFKAGKAPLLTVSGGGAQGEIALLKDLGVDEDKIITLEDPRNTEEEARFIARTLGAGDEQGTGNREQGTGRRVLLVTSAWHMPRAKMLFERTGLEVIAAPTDYEMHYLVEDLYSIRDFFPRSDVLERNSYAVKEWVARFCYWLKG